MIFILPSAVIAVKTNSPPFITPDIIAPYKNDFKASLDNWVTSTFSSNIVALNPASTYSCNISSRPSLNNPFTDNDELTFNPGILPNNSPNVVSDTPEKTPYIIEDDKSLPWTNAWFLELPPALNPIKVLPATDPATGVATADTANDTIIDGTIFPALDPNS